MKYLMCGCSHGHLANKEALDAVLKFKREYKPDKVIHLGDFTDFSAFMGAGKGTDTDADDIWSDMSEGLEFLRRLEPTHCFMGNHEERLWRLKDSKKEIVSWAAQTVIDNLKGEIGAIGAEFIEYGGMSDPTSYRSLGPLAIGHGWSFGMNAEREHATMTGQPTAIAHVHRQQMQPSYSINGPRGYSVGCLIDIKKAGYAKNNKATAGWVNGFAWGEYSDDDYSLHLERIGSWKRPTIQAI